MQRNQLYYGDNLEVLRQAHQGRIRRPHLPRPPLNNCQDYNVLFAEKDGTRSSSQIVAFEDTWEWNVDARTYEKAGKGSQVASIATNYAIAMYPN